MPQASIITIEELTGAKRRLDLFGAGLPKQGATWGGDLAMATRWNPGNGSDATQHILAPTEAPSDWEGMWNTTRLVSSPAKFSDGPGVAAVPVSRAFSLMEVCELFFRGGQRLRVTWFQGTSSSNVKLVREGRCKTWRWKITRADDIAWTMNFEWAGRGPAKGRAIDLQSDRTASSLKAANTLLAQFVSEQTADALLSSNAAIPGSADTFSLGQLEGITDSIKNFAKGLQQTATLWLNRVNDVADFVKDLSATPSLYVSTVLNIATQATQDFAQEADAMGRELPDQVSTVDGDAEQLINASSYFAGQQESAEGIMSAMAQVREEARKRASAIRQAGGGATAQGILGVVISHAGDTFVSLSLKWYANPDLASVIAAANNFTEYEVAPPVGTTLVIPTIDRSATLTKL